MWIRILSLLPQDKGWLRTGLLIGTGLLISSILAAVVVGGLWALLLYSPKAYAFNENMEFFIFFVLTPIIILIVGVRSCLELWKLTELEKTSGPKLERNSPDALFSGLRPEILFLAIMLLPLALLLLWGDLADFALATFIVAGSAYVIVRYLQSVSAWLPTVIAVAYSLSYLADKVVGHHQGPDSFGTSAEILSVIILAGIFVYCGNLIFWRGQVRASLLALIILFVPIIEVPAELFRQVVGRALYADSAGKYYTKIRPDVIFYWDSDSQYNGKKIFYLRRTEVGFVESGVGPGYIDLYIGGSMEARYLRVAPLAIHLSGLIWEED